MQRARYRVGQFVRGAAARVSETELGEARSLLPPAGLALFAALPADARRHSLNVLHTLERMGPVDADLAAAALLHDVGKLAADVAGAPIRLWMRGPLVLAEAFAPGALRRFAQREPQRRYRYAAWVFREHATIGALWADGAGCTQRTCLLIALHQASIPEGAGSGEFAVQLRALQQADNQN